MRLGFIIMSVAGKQEVLWINTLKGGCILLVVLHHTIITTFIPSLQYLTAGMIPADMWVVFNKYLSPLRMPAFFFVSGLLAASAISKRAGARYLLRNSAIFSTSIFSGV